MKLSGRPGWASRPLLALQPDGSFVAIYNDLGGPQTNQRLTGAGPLFVRSFNADGTPATRPLRLSRANDGDQPGTALAVGADGEGVAVWFEPDSDRTKPGRVMARPLRALD
ncbi:MAG TPA: hypothetical protein VHR45_23990 [Thermoanaerobaculia bacterium]|nr:hypothetical protein [Thermoanaerobaculia bacterium]